jgi:hypothetical protein
VTSVGPVEAMVHTRERLRDHLTAADPAVLDEPATARALADFFLRAVQCGAAAGPEARAAAGLTVPWLARPER